MWGSGRKERKREEWEGVGSVDKMGKVKRLQIKQRSLINADESVSKIRNDWAVD
jgi:hypothetical protein